VRSNRSHSLHNSLTGEEINNCSYSRFVLAMILAMPITQVKSVTLRFLESEAGAARLRAAAVRLGMTLSEFVRVAAHTMADASQPTAAAESDPVER
jgi:hypothetical protein